MKGTLQNIQLDLKWLYMHWKNAGGGQGAQIGFFQAAASLPHCLLDNFGWIKFATKFHVKILQKSYKIPPFSLLRKHQRFQKEGIFGDRRGGRERGGVGAGRDGAGRVLGRRAGYHDGGRGYKRARCEGGAARGGWRSAFGARRGQKRSIRASADFTQIQIILSWGALMWPYKQMLKTSLLIVLLLLVGQTLAQDLQLSEEQLKDTALLTELNNYFGCKVWSESSCLQCSERFFFNKNGVCCEVQGTCQQFNTQEGICEKCYEGYAVVDGKCAKVDKTTTSNVGCAIWNNGVCTQCSKRWFFNADKVCAPVSDLCSSWDENGACTECYYGYIVNSGACVENNDVSVVPNSNLLCRTWKGQTCIECADRTYFNENGICSSVSSQCNTFDKATGACLSCFAGYDVVDGACVYSPANTAHPADLGCGSWDWKNQVCLACSKRWAFNENKVCVPVADQCASNDETGNCASCFKGYDLKDGVCLYSDSNNAKPADSGCGTWDWDNQKCLSCSNGWVFNSNNVCTPVSDQCASHDSTGACLTCFKGYDLKEGACVFSDSNNAKPSDSGCGTWDWDNQKCLACSKGWFANADGACVPVSDQCASSNSAGNCLTCFKGYDLKDGACLFSEFNNAHPSDSGCATWDWDNQKCLSCSKNWVFNAEGVCTPVADQCASHDENGACLTCFKGYDLKDGACVFSPHNNAKPSDSGCATWDWDNQVCLACSKNWVFNADKVCVPVSDQCASSDSTGACLSCFKGYDLKEGKCIFSDFNNAKPADSGCATWDWDNQKCLSCSFGWVFNENNVCVPVSDQCATHDEKGNCLTCFKGYDVKNGVCIFSDSNNAKPSDSGCGTWDWDNQKCLSCSKGWVFNADGACVPVSDQCASSDSTGACLSCFKGYDLKDGACVFSSFNNAKPSDSGCATWDWDNQKCLSCSKNWVFNVDGACVPVSDHCASHDEKGACLTCFKGYDLKEGACVFSASNNAKPADSGCGTWDWDNQKCLACSKNWVFNSNGVCVPVSDQCASSDSTGACLTCFKGYDLKDGACVFSASNNAKPSDSGCATWDWDNQVCLACSKHWVFNSNKVCVPVSDQCASHDDSGACLSCFKGYDLKEGACVFSASNNAKPSDSGCGTWDWDNQKCLACSKGWFFNTNQVCTPISDQCASADEKGACLTCFSGYDLKDGACLFSEFNNAHPADIGCASWDWKNQKCLACSKRWFFNSHKTCVPVDDNCNTHDENGACTSCYQGYAVNSGVCVSVNPLCRTLNADGTCATCYPQNVLHNGSCVPINKLANILLYYAACCPEKLAALQASQKSN